MLIDILTLFPSMFKGVFDESIVKRAMDKKLVRIATHNLRKWAIDARGTVDDRPYSGGAGMVLRPEPIFKAVNALKSSKFKVQSSKKTQNNNNLTMKQCSDRIVLLDAGGRLYNQNKAQELSKLDRLILICGHYEGVDFRVHEHLADEVISIGDYVLTGGEIPAMVIIDSVVRLIPRVLTKKEAVQYESFSNQLSEISSQKSENRQPTTDNRQLLEYPQYTRPQEYKGRKVPKILLSGNHSEIEKWRVKQALKRTKENRPDLLK